MRLKDYRKVISECHKYHKDKNVHVVRKVDGGKHHMIVLVRVTSENGIENSVLDMIDAEGNVSEIGYSLREREGEMVFDYLQGEENE